MPSPEKEWHALMTFVDGLAPAISRAVLAAFLQAGAKLKVSQVAQWILTGNTDAVVQAALGAFATDGIEDATRAALAKSGLQSQQLLPSLRVRFDGLSDDVVRYLRTAELNLITNITNDTRAGIRQFLLDGLQQKKAPAALARDIRSIIGLTPQQAQAVANYRRELETLDSNALERALRDRRFDATVRAAIQARTPLSRAEIEKRVTRYQERFLTFRANMIARTEALNALHAGQRLAWQQAIQRGAVDGGALVRRWYVAKDERVCKTCAPIPRLNPDGRGWNEHFILPNGTRLWGPTAHPLCRCVVFTRPRVE